MSDLKHANAGKGTNEGSQRQSNHSETSMPDNTISDERKTQVFGMNFLQEITEEEIEADTILGGAPKLPAPLRLRKTCTATAKTTGWGSTDCDTDTDWW